MGFLDSFDINTLIALATFFATTALATVSYMVLRQSTKINKELLDLEKYRFIPHLVLVDNPFGGNKYISFTVKNTGGRKASDITINLELYYGKEGFMKKTKKIETKIDDVISGASKFVVINFDGFPPICNRAKMIFKYYLHDGDDVSQLDDNIEYKVEKIYGLNDRSYHKFILKRKHVD